MVGKRLGTASAPTGPASAALLDALSNRGTPFLARAVLVWPRSAETRSASSRPPSLSFLREGAAALHPKRTVLRLGAGTGDEVQQFSRIRTRIARYGWPALAGLHC